MYQWFNTNLKKKKINQVHVSDMLRGLINEAYKTLVGAVAMTGCMYMYQYRSLSTVCFHIVVNR